MQSQETQWPGGKVCTSDLGSSPNGPSHDFHRTAEHVEGWTPHGKQTGERGGRPQRLTKALLTERKT